MNLENIKKIVPPCTYQGAKQRVAKEIVDIILDRNMIYNDTKFYDLCCGTGSISIELINRGFKPENIVMLDKSSWGKFWNTVGNGEFDFDIWNNYINQIPNDIKEIQLFLKNLSKQNPEIDEEYVYLLLQAGSFGGKQIWKENYRWNNTSFRNYWLPTETSNRKSPVNPMMPMPQTITNRLKLITDKCKGLTCLNLDIWEFLEYIRFRNTDHSIFYIDPPYKDTTGYGFGFDWEEFISELFNETLAPIYVSECKSYSDDSFQLSFSGSKGGISGVRNGKNEEYLNEFR